MDKNLMKVLPSPHIPWTDGHTHTHTHTHNFPGIFFTRWIEQHHIITSIQVSLFKQNRCDSLSSLMQLQAGCCTHRGPLVETEKKVVENVWSMKAVLWKLLYANIRCHRSLKHYLLKMSYLLKYPESVSFKHFNCVNIVPWYSSSSSTLLCVDSSPCFAIFSQPCVVNIQNRNKILTSHGCWL